jgi:hypothetical protein
MCAVREKGTVVKGCPFDSGLFCCSCIGGTKAGGSGEQRGPRCEAGLVQVKARKGAAEATRFVFMHVQYAPSAEDTRCLEAGVVAAYWRDHSERSCNRREWRTTRAKVRGRIGPGEGAQGGSGSDTLCVETCAPSEKREPLLKDVRLIPVSSAALADL